ncbi:MAG: hypothetical protein C0468_01785 [Planctomyces sp.]|nr:hypothetical protein [Planctomyces sp.]
MTASGQGNPGQNTDVWTTRRLLGWTSDAFARRGLDSPRLMAEVLLAHTIGCDRLRLYTDPDRPTPPPELATLRALVARALRHEPVQYLTGEAWFFGLPMHADRRALIPRPCTELLVETVLQRFRLTTTPVPPAPEPPAPEPAEPTLSALPADEPSHATPTPTPAAARRPQQHAPALIADVCTGSGCVAVAIARHMPSARLVATDISPGAIELARANAQRHGVGARVDLRTGDLLEPLADLAGSLDALLSNPPYIPDSEWGDVPPNVRDHEPELALRGGADGLRFVLPVLSGAPRLLRPGGLLMIELAAATAAQALAAATLTPGLTDPRVLKDLDGLDRVLTATRAG